MGQNGLKTRWVESQGGDGKVSIAGVPVEKLECYVKEYSYHISPDVAEELCQRGQLLGGLRVWRQKPERHKELAEDWQRSVAMFLGGVYAFQEAVNSISRRYFDGHEVLFPDLAKGLAQLVKETEGMVAEFNEECDRPGEQVVVDLEAARRSAAKEGAAKIASLVDTAKAEALEDMGEQEAAVELVGRYLT